MEDIEKMSRDFEEGFQKDARNEEIAGRELVMNQCGMPVAIMLSLPRGAIACDRPVSCTFNCTEGKLIDVICMRAHMLNGTFVPAQYWFLDQSQIAKIDTAAVSHTSQPGSEPYVDSLNLVVYAQVTGRPRFISWIDGQTQLKCYGRRSDGDHGFRHAALGGHMAVSEPLLEHSETVRAALLMGASGASEAELRANRSLPALTGPQMIEAESKMSVESWSLFVRGYKALARGRGWMSTIVLDQSSSGVASGTAKRLKGSSLMSMTPTPEQAVSSTYEYSQTGPIPMTGGPKGTILVTTRAAMDAVPARRKGMDAAERKEEVAHCRKAAAGHGMLGEWRSKEDLTGVGLPVSTRVELFPTRTRQKSAPPLDVVGPIGTPGNANATMVPGNLGTGAKYIETVTYGFRDKGAILTHAGAGEFGDLAFRELSGLMTFGPVVVDCYDVGSRNADRTSLVQCTAQGTLLGGSNTIWQIRKARDEIDSVYQRRVSANLLFLAASTMGESVRTYPIFGMAHPTVLDIPGCAANAPSTWTPHIASWGSEYHSPIGSGLPQISPDGGIFGARIFGNLEYPGCRAAISTHGALRARHRASIFEPGPVPDGLPRVEGAILMGANAAGESRSAIRLSQGEICVIVASPALGGFRLSDSAPTPLYNQEDGPGNRLLGCGRVGFHQADETVGLAFSIRSGHVSAPTPVLVCFPKPRTYESVSSSALSGDLANAWGAPVEEGTEVSPLEVEALYRVMLRQVDVAAAQRRAGGAYGRTHPEVGLGDDDELWAFGVFAKLADVRTQSGAQDEFERHYEWSSRLDTVSLLYDQLVRGASERALQVIAALNGGLESPVEERLASDCFVLFDSTDRSAMVDSRSGRVALFVKGRAKSERTDFMEGHIFVNSRSRLVTGASKLRDNPRGYAEESHPRGASIGREATRSGSRPRTVDFAPSAPEWEAAFSQFTN